MGNPGLNFLFRQIQIENLTRCSRRLPCLPCDLSGVALAKSEALPLRAKWGAKHALSLPKCRGSQAVEGCSTTSPPAGNAQPRVGDGNLTADTCPEHRRRTCIEDRFGSDL